MSALSSFMVAVSRDGGDEVVWTGNGLVDCTGERYGLLAQVKDPAEYTAMPGVVPGFVRVQPAPVAAGAGNGAVALYKEQKEDEYNTWELWSKRLRVTIFMGLGKTLQLEITDLVTRVVTMSNLEIMTHLRGLFAAPTATFIAELKANLKTPLQGSVLRLAWSSALNVADGAANSPQRCVMISKFDIVTTLVTISVISS